MENNNEPNGFQYTYSAREQEEVKRIREKYIKKEENKMERLRQLDASVTQKALLVSLVFGVLGALTLGFGMSMCMTDIGELLGSYREMSMILGVVIGVVGGVLVSLAYPMYHVILKREREKKAPEILKLTEELMK